MAEPFRYSFAVIGISLEKVLDLSNLNVPGYSPHARYNISNQPSLLHGSHQAEQVTCFR
jgi:hypothetical protein